jgi:diguanylate cyclase (GGDEF)-like protein/PAS domain S-box-containing protein
VLPDCLVFVDDAGMIRDVNAAFKTLSGYFFDEIVGQPIERLVPTKSRRRHFGKRNSYIRNPTSRTLAVWRDLNLLTRDGREVPVDISLSPFEIDGRVWTVAAVRDNSDKKALDEARLEADRRATEIEAAALEALSTSEQRFRLAFEDNMAPMVFSDMNDLAIDVNDAFCQMVGFTREELLGKDSKQFTFPEDEGITEATHSRLVSGVVDQMRYTKRYLRKDGRVIVAEVSRSAARDASGNALYFVSSERDITEQNELTDQLTHQALHDSLTGLANRALFEDRLTQAYARVRRHGGSCAVLLLDLDDFKGVNDAYGHLVGDQLLVGIARRLELVTRSSDTLCRLGGDEFLYLAEGLTSAAEASEVAERLLVVLTEPFEFNGLTLVQHASVGVVVCDGTNSDAHQYIQEADIALYEAKRLTKGQYAVFASSMRQTAVNRFSMAQELRQALKAGHLSMHYQPIIDLVSTEIIGFEALMRWNHPEQGWIPPNVFIPLAEESELILELGSFAMHEALAAASSWARPENRDDDLFVTVNLSAHQFHSPGLIAMTESALSESGLSPQRLVIEITESVALLNAAETTETMSHLRSLGIGVALDDFGTGYSSLSYLAQLQPRIIKVDRSFVSPAGASDDHDTLLEAIVSLGLKLNTLMLAEGIETKEQLERLRRLGCQFGQGFLFSRAVPLDEVRTMLTQTTGSWGAECLPVQPRLALPGL